MNVLEPCTAAERKLIDSLVDGSLHAETRARVAAHLEDCASCRAERDDLQTFETAMLSLHLTTEKIIETAWREGPSRAAGANGEHLDACGACRAEVEAVRSSRPPEAAYAHASPFISPRWSRSLPLTLAAVLIAALGVALADRLSLQRSDDALSKPSGRRGTEAQMLNVTPVGDLPRSVPALTFSWMGSADRDYAVSFFAEDGRLLARVEARGTPLLAEAALRGTLEGQPLFFWKVETANDVGPMLSSDLVRVVWRP